MPHKHSFYNIIGTTEPTEEQLNYYSAEQHVDEKTCPVFIVHTATDELVPVQNALCMAMACAYNKVPFELHVYPEAPHGIALANEITARGSEAWIKPQAARWVDDSVYFLKHL